MRTTVKNIARPAFRNAHIGSLLNYLKLFLTYKTRVEDDSGTINSDTITKDIFKDLPAQDSIEFAWIGGAGSNKRTSTIYKFFTKLYSLFGTNDATQTTESLQPYVSGNIAPNEVECLKEPDGDTRLMTYPDIIVSGIYTITSVEEKTDSGKTVVTHTEVTEGTLNSIAVSGRLYAYIVRNTALTESQKAVEENLMLSIYPEIPSVQIGTQTWATSNFEAVATPMGNVIQEMQDASAVERLIDDGTFESYADTAAMVVAIPMANSDETATWTLNTTNPIGETQDGLLEVTSVGTVSTRPLVGFGSSERVVGQWRKLSFDYKVNSGTCVLQSFFRGGSAQIVTVTLSGTNTFEYYYQVDGANNNLQLSFDGRTLFNVQLDNISDEQLGWEDSQELYDGLIAQGESVQTALEASAMWCYYNNDSQIGAVYGKLYNYFAVQLLQADIDSYNTANPTTPFGWHIHTQAEFTTLQTYLGGSSVAGGKMKVTGTDYWNSHNTGADNSSGFSALGGGVRNGRDGSFASIKANIYIWNTNGSINVLYYDGTQIVNSNPSLGAGGSIRLIKD